MNFLGHLYLSGDNPSLMLANLYGDFIKGKDYSYLPPIVQKGVSLHRQIDDFVDNFPQVVQLRHQLYKDLPKVAGIAIDLYFDYCLAKNWNDYHPISLPNYVTNFFRYTNNATHFTINNFTYKKSFIELIQIMQARKWLTRYAKIEGLTMASSGLSRRISFENNLDFAPSVFIKKQIIIEETFTSYMNVARKKFKI